MSRLTSKANQQLWALLEEKHGQIAFKSDEANMWKFRNIIYFITYYILFILLVNILYYFKFTTKDPTVLQKVTKAFFLPYLKFQNPKFNRHLIKDSILC